MRFRQEQKVVQPLQAAHQTFGPQANLIRRLFTAGIQNQHDDGPCLQPTQQQRTFSDRIPPSKLTDPATKPPPKTRSIR